MKEKPSIKQKIIRLLSKFTPLHEDDISAAIEANPTSVHVELHNLRKNGMVGKSQSTHGYWYVNDDEVKKEGQN